MNAAVIVKGTVLMPERGNMGSAIQCLSADEKGFRFRRLHVSYGGEEFFLTPQALATSQWVECPMGSQLRFL